MAGFFDSCPTALIAARGTNLENKNVLITGANTGIGKETARVLLLCGANVYMACRDLNKCNEAIREIEIQTGINGQLFPLELDLTSLDSVRNCAKEFNKLNKALHILINNAGVMMPPYSTTREGFELQMGVNHFAHFLLTNLLVNKLKQGAPSRVICISSIAHERGSINFDNINWQHNYHPFFAYASSKLANVLFANEFNKRFSSQGIYANSLHPGVIPTELSRHSSLASIFYGIGKLFMKSIEQGAATTVYVATAPELERVGGRYFSDCAQKNPSTIAQDSQLALNLWEYSTNVTSLEQSILDLNAFDPIQKL
eukprot:TRINITY_DN165_c0_g3_i3.p1 TRINITY_DN165_c0_g3~~TRINITY_DN165_c0_g3_i3.p1  ORF type:complete len:314 (-),score=170.78 TRINITY_DN165_c0_g3_i3:88-1029(-)